jgi:mono/diheme cytochrome c family protein
MARSFKTASTLALLFASCVAGAAGEHWSAPSAAAKRRNPVPFDAASIEQGKQLFKQNCVVCHGSAGHGDGPGAASLKPQPADLAMMAGHHPDGDLAWKIANGRGAMPSWKASLSDQQIWNLVNYLKSLGAAQAQPQGTGQHHHH